MMTQDGHAVESRNHYSYAYLRKVGRQVTTNTITLKNPKKNLSNISLAADRQVRMIIVSTIARLTTYGIESELPGYVGLLMKTLWERSLEEPVIRSTYGDVNYTTRDDWIFRCSREM